MKITKEILDGLEILTEALTKTQDALSEKVKNVKMYKGDVEHQVTREGKTLQIKEKHLWDEVYYLGENSQAGQILRKKYPEIFELWDDERKISKDYNLYAKANINIDPGAMKISDFIKLIIGLIEYKNGELKPETKEPSTEAKEQKTANEGTHTPVKKD